jgi:hypothetical protein
MAGAVPQASKRKSAPMIRSMTAALLATALLAAPAVAAPPPADAMPLSEILRSLEAQPDFSYVDDIEWDDDGYWEIEYVRSGGGKVEIRIDPVSGQPRT